ncbi:MAG: HypC/HybG/HupF family hydrogenase formation chaperone [Methylacidiphilales bacterium]|nr:HypC/HybG/HupF family hydrogenase formation chaperone [Candidatus Methylacidiphilales bacterium]
MNLIYGEIVDVLAGPETRLGKIRIGGAVKIISLDLLTDPVPGDKVLVCEGVAIGKVDGPASKETAYVPGHTR